MHLSSLIYTAAYITLASGECFGSGQKWDGDKDAVISFVTQKCNANFNADGFKGPWEKKGNGTPYRSGRLELSNGRYARLAMFRIGNGGTDAAGYMDPADCIDWFKKEINRCEHGGRSQYTNWEYKADINKKGTNDDDTINWW
ncbi:hypothetical protein F4819DRAFT_484733 [Hypoxylon fuscum]|nr:hypothetical protein F4819DRAFT_484733 [Hypoxylon fuscum]